MPTIGITAVQVCNPHRMELPSWLLLRIVKTTGYMMRLSATFFGSMLLLGSMLLVAPSASAQNYTWTGAVSSDWNTAGNWSPNGVPSYPATIDFGSVARTNISISASSNSAGGMTFGTNAPAYTLSISAAPGVYPTLNLYDSTSNQSTTARPTFVVATQASLGLRGIISGIAIDNSSSVLLSGSQVSLSNSSIVNQNGGMINYAVGDGLSTESSSIVNDLGASIDISDDFGNFVATIGSLSGAGNVYLGSHALALGAMSSNDTISGVIADGGSVVGSGGTLTKIGYGTLLLTGANTYTGQTTVQSGKLQVDGSLASPSVLVDSGAVIAGAGTIGDLLAQANSVIIPGNANADSKLSAGRLQCANSPIVQERIGNISGETHGTYLLLSQPLNTGFCPDLYFRFLSAGVPLAVGESYLLANIQGSTNYSAISISISARSRAITKLPARFLSAVSARSPQSTSSLRASATRFLVAASK